MGNCWVVSSLGLQPGVWVKMTQMSRREECAGTWGPLSELEDVVTAFREPMAKWERTDDEQII